MGFKKPVKIYVLSFDEEEYEGLEIKVRGMSMKEMLDISRLEGKEDRESIVLMMRLFAEKIVSWNMEEEDGTPVPHTAATLMDLDPEFVGACIGSYMGAVKGVSDPLEKPSDSGPSSLAASIPMETL